MRYDACWRLWCICKIVLVVSLMRVKQSGSAHLQSFWNLVTQKIQKPHFSYKLINIIIKTCCMYCTKYLQFVNAIQLFTYLNTTLLVVLNRKYLTKFNKERWNILKTDKKFYLFILMLMLQNSEHRVAWKWRVVEISFYWVIIWSSLLKLILNCTQPYLHSAAWGFAYDFNQ